MTGILKAYRAVFKSSECGANSQGGGGFQPGNTCGGKKGGGDASGREPGSGVSPVSPSSMKTYAETVDGGASPDREIGGALVPHDPEIIVAAHRKNMSKIAEKVGVPDTTVDGIVNGAKTVEQLVQDSSGAAPEFRSMVEEAAASTGSEANFGPGNKFILKPKDSLSRKVMARIQSTGKHEADVVAGISDSVRGTLISDSPEALGESVRSFVKQVESRGGYVQVSNKFDDDLPGGYGAVHCDVLMRSPSGRMVSGELQFHLRAIHDGSTDSAKEQSHKLYEHTRAGGYGAKAMAAMSLIFATASAHAVGAI